MRKRQISTVLLVVMVFAIVSPMISSIQGEPQTIVEIYPETTTVELGETFSVYVNIVDVNNLAGFEFKLAHYNYILEVVDVSKGPFFPYPTNFMSWIDGVYTGQPTGNADVVQDGILDIYDYVFIVGHWYIPDVIEGPCGYDPRADIWPVGGDGRVSIGDAGMLGTAWGNTYVDMPGTISALSFVAPVWSFPQSGSGTLVEITFKAMGFGETVLDLYDTKLSLICGEAIPHEARDGTVIVPVQPEEAMQRLVTDIESWNLPGGTENSLTSKLEEAILLFNQNNLNGAVRKLGDFMNQVEAMRDKKLTDEQADYLIAIAQVIIDAIG